MTATKFLTASALTLALAAPAAAQMVLQSWDVDGDGLLTGAEFRGLFNDNPTFAAIDSDDDGMLSESEYQAYFAGDVSFAETTFGSYAFADFDLNSDGLVAEAEYQEGFLTVYDADGDGTINEAEFTNLSDDFEVIGTDM